MDRYTEDRVRYLAQEIALLIRCDPETIIVLSHKGEVVLKHISMLSPSYISGSRYPQMEETYMKSIDSKLTSIPEPLPSQAKDKTNNHKLLLL